MPCLELAPYQTSLREWAANLLGSNPPVPVLLNHVCKSVGVRLKRSETVPSLKAYLSVDPSKEALPAILLPTTRRFLNFQRLCAAHELGHYFLLSKYNLLPRTTSEYWQHERLCDDFARHLLIPEQYLREKTTQTPFDLASFSSLCREISSVARIPWAHASIRITERKPHVVFLRCSLVTEKSRTPKDHDRNEEVLPFVVRASSLPEQRGIGTLIRQTTPLHSMFHTMLSEARGGERGRIQREITTELKASITPELKSSLRGIISENTVALAETEKGPYADIKIVIVSPRLPPKKPARQ